MIEDNNTKTILNENEIVNETVNNLFDNKIINNVSDAVASGVIESGVEIIGRYSIKVICEVVNGIFDGI